jgi:membrane protein DedA with SNARE-associated domain
VTHLLDHLLLVPPAVAYLVIGLLTFAEAALFVGFVLPGETAVILGGALAASHRLSLTTLLVLVVTAAVVGDTVGYEVGRHLGTRILRWEALERRRHRIDAARDFLSRRGGTAVFLGRWTAFFRAVMPALAGTARMPYRRFLVFNVAGGVTWGVTVVLVGYLAGASYVRIEKLLGRGAALVVAAVVVAGVVVWQVRRRRAE